MAPERRSRDHLLPLVLVLVAGAVLWYAHAESWDLGGRSPVLSYDSAQYALAARELAWHGRLATPFALPIDLAWHAKPPWALSAVQPGLVLIEAAIFKLVPARGMVAGSDPRAWLTLLLPFVCYLSLGACVVLGTRHLIAHHVPDAPRWLRVGAPATLGLMVLLDAEAQHYAISGLTELPFTVLLVFAAFVLARGGASQLPFTFGVLLGLAGLFRANMLWLAPLYALAAAWCAPAGTRVRTLALALLGYALPLVPWWIYKWRAFGSPAWDLTRFEVWDQIEGRSWFQLFHRADVPAVPAGAHAMALLAGKSWHNLSRLVLPLLTGPRGLWLGALACWLLTRRGAPESSRPLTATAAVVLAGLVLNTLAASLGMPIIRYVFPTRVLAELAGVLALGSLLRRIPGTSEQLRAALCGVAALLALGWGTVATRAGQEESRATSRERGVPSSRTLTAISVTLNGALAPGEVVMSNLGPALAWQTNHPVVHLAYAPSDVAACRARAPFRNIVLVFRSAERAWDQWQEIVERPGTAETHAELLVRRERRYTTADGFTVVWLELGPLPPQVAAVER